MSTTYKAVVVTKPGEFLIVEKSLSDPKPGHVRVRVEACGICHSDSGTVEGVFPIKWPRVPGHEVVGRIDALGEGVLGWQLGQRLVLASWEARAATVSFAVPANLSNARISSIREFIPTADTPKK